MAIIHEFTCVFVEDGGQDFLGVLTVYKGAGTGGVFFDVESGQHCFPRILAEIFAESGVVGRVVVVRRLFVSGIVFWGVFVGFDCRAWDGGCRWRRCLHWIHCWRGHGISETLALYFQGGYARRVTRRCGFRDGRCRGLCR